MNWTNSRYFREAEIARERERRAFYAEALPCESCGDPCQEDERVFNPDWELMIGTKCSCAVAVQEQPVCPDLYRLFVSAAGTISELREIAQAHKTTCEFCTPELARKTPRREVGSAGSSERRVA